MKNIKTLLVSIGSFLFVHASCQSSDTTALSNEQFRQIASGKEVIILDVRTSGEYGQGYIPKAMNIDVLQEEVFKKKIASLPKDKTYLLYCRAGKRSATALKIMKEHG